MPSGRLIGILLVGTAAIAGAIYLRQFRSTRGSAVGMSAEAAEVIARRYLAIEEREQAMDRTLWAPEIDAERFENELTRIWDEMNASSNHWSILKSFPLNRLQVLNIGAPVSLAHGVTRWLGDVVAPYKMGQRRRNPVQEEWESAGWILEGIHLAMTSHQAGAGTQPARSTVQVSARLKNPLQDVRAVLRARVLLEWESENPAAPTVTALTVEDLEILTRSGTPPFKLWLEAELPPAAGTFNDPLMVRDLTGDGRPEILLAGAGEVWINATADSSTQKPFRRERAGSLPTERIQAAVLADVNGDRKEDLVLAGKGGVQWIAGTGNLPWGTPGSGWRAPVPLNHAQALTASDVDGDGDVDLWLVQYKLPYQQGQFPTPWYDAHDGFPAYLLLNDGRGRFTDATGAAGLGRIRNRRSYSASLVDLDRDGDSDLINVSDFAGLDVLLNDGHGRFHDVTASLGDARHAFGMAHAVNDFNADGRPDLLMLGMGSTVAERLEKFGLERRAPGEGPGMVREMIHGNRLFLGDRNSDAPLKSATGPEAQGLRATGWTWGGAWEDFDNDGRLDLAVANGHETRASTADYDRQFWLNDRFVARSTNDPAAEHYFRTAAGHRQAAGASYGGWQDNQFRLQLPDGDFPDVAWLFGLAVPADCRNLIGADLDLDGRLDLVVTTQEGWPAPRQRLLVFRNELELSSAAWIGFRFTGAPPPGTRVELELPDKTPTRWLITGEGFRSQGPAAAQFGLGSQSPSAAKIYRPGAALVTLQNPAVNQWHVIPPPETAQ
jgi:enediyne biosynthesis protein E4